VRRTFDLAATNLAAAALKDLNSFDSMAGAKRNIVRAVEVVSHALGNTATVCEVIYSPGHFEAYLDGTLIEGVKHRPRKSSTSPGSALTSEEMVVSTFLARRLRSLQSSAG